MDCSAAVFNFSAIYEQKQAELYQLARDMEADVPTSPNRAKLLLALIKKASEQKRAIRVQGVFESLSDDLGGLLVYQSDNYRIQLSVLYLMFSFKPMDCSVGILWSDRQSRASGSTSSGLILDIGHGSRAEYFDELTHLRSCAYYPLDRILLNPGRKNGIIYRWGC